MQQRKWKPYRQPKFLLNHIVSDHIFQIVKFVFLLHLDYNDFFANLGRGTGASQIGQISVVYAYIGIFVKVRNIQHLWLIKTN